MGHLSCYLTDMCSKGRFCDQSGVAAKEHFALIIGITDYRLAFADMKDLHTRVLFFSRLAGMLSSSTGLPCYELIFVLSILYHDGHLKMSDNGASLPAFLEVINGRHLRPVYPGGKKGDFYDIRAPMGERVKEDDLPEAVVSTVIDLVELSKILNGC